MTQRVGQGGTITLDATFQDGTSALVNPTDPRVDILDPFNVAIVTNAIPTNDALGRFSYVYAVPGGATLGSWTAHWTGTINGVPVEDDDSFDVVDAGDIGFPGSAVDALTCAPWASEADLCAPCLSYDDDLTLAAADMIQEASDLLYEWSGRKYPGVCTTTVRPCAVRYGGGRDRRSLPAGYTSGWGSCGCADACGCPSAGRIELGAAPITAVLAVKVDGVVLDPSLYRVDNKRTLVRLADPDGSNPGWPFSQDLALPDTAEGTFSVTYQWGRNPPPAGVHAAAVLACELAMACDPDQAPNCRLSARNVSQVSREGVTVVLNASSFLDATGKTGLWEVDLFLSASNPTGQRRQSTVWWPGASRVVRPG